MHVAAGFQRGANRADPAIHHVAGRDDVGAGFGMRYRLAHQGGIGFIVQHVTAGVDQSVLAVRGVGVQRHVGDHAQVREIPLQRADRALRQAVAGPGGDAVERLRLRGGHREQSQRRNLQGHRLLGNPQQLVNGQAIHAGHGRDRGTAVQFVDEHGEDQVIAAQSVLAHQAAGKIIAAHAARTGVWEGHRQLLF